MKYTLLRWTTLVLAVCLCATGCNRNGNKSGRDKKSTAPAAQADPLAAFEKELCTPAKAAHLMESGALVEFTARLNYAQITIDTPLQQYIEEQKAMGPDPTAAPPMALAQCKAVAQAMECDAIYSKIAEASARMIEEQQSLFANVSDDYLEDLDLPKPITKAQVADAAKAMGITDCARVSIDTARQDGEAISNNFFAARIQGRLQLFYMDLNNNS